MHRSIFLVLVLLILSPMSQGANLNIEGLPVSYAPGSTLNFDAVLNGAQSLASYQIDLVFQGLNVASLLSLNVPDPSSNTGYIFFNSSDGFISNISYPTGNNNEIRLSLADSTSSPVTSSVGSDLIANLQLSINPNFTGNFIVFVDNSPGMLILDNSSGSSIPNYNQIVVSPSVNNPKIITPFSVPEPSSIILLTFALLVYVGFKCFGHCRKDPLTHH